VNPFWVTPWTHTWVPLGRAVYYSFMRLSWKALKALWKFYSAPRESRKVHGNPAGGMKRVQGRRPA